MPARKRMKTSYPGVYYIEGAAIGSGKPERVYYLLYWKGGKLIEEKAGRAFRDRMTAAKANQMRARRMSGREPTNKERRERERQARKPQWTITLLWELYLSQTELKGIGQDRNKFTKYLKPSFGNRDPRSLVALDVDRLRIRMLKDGKAPQTVRLTLGLLVRIIRFAVRKGLCRPLDFQVEMPRVDNIVTEDLTPAQLQALLAAIDQDPDKDAGDIMRLALYSGMRRGEIFNLKWEDIDFERGFISIRDPKGKKSQKIPLNDLARDLLTSRRLQRAESEYVFPGRDGQRRTAAANVSRIRDGAGLPKDFRPLHGLRHTYASMLASSGKVDLYVLQRLMTHKSADMTQRYAHLRDEALKRGADVASDTIKDILSKR